MTHSPPLQLIPSGVSEDLMAPNANCYSNKRVDVGMGMSSVGILEMKSNVELEIELNVELVDELWTSSSSKSRNGHWLSIELWKHSMNSLSTPDDFEWSCWIHYAGDYTQITVNDAGTHKHQSTSPDSLHFRREHCQYFKVKFLILKTWNARRCKSRNLRTFQSEASDKGGSIGIHASRPEFTQCAQFKAHPHDHRNMSVSRMTRISTADFFRNKTGVHLKVLKVRNSRSLELCVLNSMRSFF